MMSFDGKGRIKMIDIFVVTTYLSGKLERCLMLKALTRFLTSYNNIYLNKDIFFTEPPRWPGGSREHSKLFKTPT
jgi:hypothetical protein